MENKTSSISDSDVTPKATFGPLPVLWNPNAAGLWSLILTPIFGSYLLLRNWREIGDAQSQRSAKIWMIASLLMIIPSLLFGPLGFIYLIVWYYGAQKKQYRYVKERWGDDYPRKPWAKVLGVAFAVYIVVLLPLVIVNLALSIPVK